MISVFSIMLTAITILKQELSIVGLKVKEESDLNDKLKYDLSFIKLEWEYISSPRNIQNLADLHLDYQQASLLNINDLLKILKNSEGKK